MIRSLVLVAPLVALLGLGAPLAAQERFPLLAPAVAPDLPPASMDGPGQTRTLATAELVHPLANVRVSQERAYELPGLTRERTGWLPVAGAVIGAGAGYAYGLYQMSTYDHIGPPTYLVTIPIGVLVGTLVGLIVEEEVSDD